VVLENDGEDQLDRAYGEMKKYYIELRRKETYYKACPSESGTEVGAP
jgi:hypothetical protein